MGDSAQLHSDLDALVGSVIHDRYRVDALLGVGGMGAVFRAHHTGLKRNVALKVLHPEIGRDASVSKRFDREATSASRLDHPHCVRVTDFGTTENGTKYLVMEFLEGHELKDLLGKPMPPAQAVGVAIQIFEGLEHAHHFGVVHRDLKPENVFVTKDYRGQEIIKIVDFGIAKLIDAEGGSEEKLTRAGLVFGTPRYMSPEQAAGGKIDERTDLYAAGLILYEMLAGNVPFDSDEPGQLLRMQIMAPPPPLPTSVPEPLAKIVDKLLEKSKSERYASAREVLDVLVPLERQLGSQAPMAPVSAPVVPEVIAGSAVRTTVEARPRSKSMWQPVDATTALPPVPPAPTGLHAPPVTSSHAAVPPPGPTGSHATIPVTGSVVVSATGLVTGSYGAVDPTSPTILSTGSHGALPLDPQASSASISAPSHSYPSAQVPFVATPEQRRRAWVPWVIAGGAVFIALMAVGALLSMDESQAAGDASSEQPKDSTGVVAAPDAKGDTPGSAATPGSTPSEASARSTPSTNGATDQGATAKPQRISPAKKTEPKKAEPKKAEPKKAEPKAEPKSTPSTEPNKSDEEKRREEQRRQQDSSEIPDKEDIEDFIEQFDAAGQPRGNGHAKDKNKGKKHDD